MCNKLIREAEKYDELSEIILPWTVPLRACAELAEVGVGGGKRAEFREQRTPTAGLPSAPQEPCYKKELRKFAKLLFSQKNPLSSLPTPLPRSGQIISDPQNLGEYASGGYFGSGSGAFDDKRTLLVAMRSENNHVVAAR